MLPPRSVLAEDSPITQRIASITLDLPQPLGPTMPIKLFGTETLVVSTKDLNPDNLTCFNRIRFLKEALLEV